MKRFIRNWTLPLLVALACIAIASLGEVGRQTFQYRKPDVDMPWLGLSHRWLTGHFTHIGWPHLTLNIFGLIGIWMIYGRALRLRVWLLFLLLCPVGISLGFRLFSPEVTYYLGLSGVLHGLLALAVMTTLLQRPSREGGDVHKTKWEELLLFVALWIKIIYEQCVGAIPMTAAISGDRVLVDSHLYGAYIGTAFAAMLWVYGFFNQRFFNRINEPYLDHDLK